MKGWMVKHRKGDEREQQVEMLGSREWGEGRHGPREDDRAGGSSGASGRRNDTAVTGVPYARQSSLNLLCVAGGGEGRERGVCRQWGGDGGRRSPTTATADAHRATEDGRHRVFLDVAAG